MVPAVVPDRVPASVPVMVPGETVYVVTLASALPEYEYDQFLVSVGGVNVLIPYYETGTGWVGVLLTVPISDPADALESALAWKAIADADVAAGLIRVAVEGSSLVIRRGLEAIESVVVISGTAVVVMDELR